MGDDKWPVEWSGQADVLGETLSGKGGDGGQIDCLHHEAMFGNCPGHESLRNNAEHGAGIHQEMGCSATI